MQGVPAHIAKFTVQISCLHLAGYLHLPCVRCGVDLEQACPLVFGGTRVVVTSMIIRGGESMLSADEQEGEGGSAHHGAPVFFGFCIPLGCTCPAAAAFSTLCGPGRC